MPPVDVEVEALEGGAGKVLQDEPRVSGDRSTLLVGPNVRNTSARLYVRVSIRGQARRRLIPQDGGWYGAALGDDVVLRDAARADTGPRVEQNQAIQRE